MPLIVIGSYIYRHKQSGFSNAFGVKRQPDYKKADFFRFTAKRCPLKRFLHHHNRLSRCVQRIAPQRAFRIHVIAFHYRLFDRQMHEFIVDKAYQGTRFSRHCRMHGMVSQPFTIDGIDGRRCRRSDMVTRIDVF